MGRGPNTNKFRHNRIENVALPYITNASVIESRPHLISGSTDLLQTVQNTLIKRPGFPTYTADSYGANPEIVRWFTWQRWGGGFYVMICVIDATAGSSKVYKQLVGTDATFQLIHTDATSSEPFDFEESNNHVFFANGTDMKKYDGTTVSNWGITAPTAAPTATDDGAGNVPGAIGHYWAFAYCNSSTGYISDLSPVSVVRATANRDWSISGARCTDAQCDQVRVYRVEDGGTVLLELSNSPIANPGAGAWTVVDNDADASLQQSKPAALAGVNAKPTSLKGVKFWNGRMWGFKEDRVWFSTAEENTNSVPEECFGQERTNSRSFGAQVLGLGRTRDFLLVFTTRGIRRIGGDTLATLSYTTLSETAGVRNRATIAEFDNVVAWLDISNTVQITDGYSIPEDDISLPIRPDIESITHASASMAFYSTGKYKWLVLCDGGASKLRVYNANLKMWAPPWSITTLESVGVGQTAAGTMKLFVGKGGKPLAVSHSSYQDDGSSYTGVLFTNLFPINSENPTGVSDLEYVGFEKSSVAFDEVAYLVDESPSGATYTSIFANQADPPYRTQGTNLKDLWYWSRSPAAQRVSIKASWAAGTDAFTLYSIDVVHNLVN